MLGVFRQHMSEANHNWFLRFTRLNPLGSFCILLYMDFIKNDANYREIETYNFAIHSVCMNGICEYSANVQLNLLNYQIMVWW